MPPPHLPPPRMFRQQTGSIQPKQWVLEKISKTKVARHPNLGRVGQAKSGPIPQDPSRRFIAMSDVKGGKSQLLKLL